MFDIRNPEQNQALNQEQLAKYQKERDEAKKAFANVFNTPEGEKVIEYLKNHALAGFPDYNNVNVTYAQIGKQKLIDKINQMRKVGE